VDGDETTTKIRNKVKFLLKPIQLQVEETHLVSEPWEIKQMLTEYFQTAHNNSYPYDDDDKNEEETKNMNNKKPRILYSAGTVSVELEVTQKRGRVGWNECRKQPFRF